MEKYRQKVEKSFSLALLAKYNMRMLISKLDKSFFRVFFLQRLIVEFALEDARIVRVREERSRRRREGAPGGQKGAQNSVAGGPGNDKGEEGVKRRNKKVEWKIKSKEKRIRQRERRQERVDKDSPVAVESSKPPTTRDGGQDRERMRNGGDQSGRKGFEKRTNQREGKVGNGVREGKSVNGWKRKSQFSEKETKELKRKRNRDRAELPNETAGGGEKRIKLSRKQSRKVTL